MIGIVDYNVGNLASVINALDKLNIDAKLESDPEKLKNYDKIILPGVGAFGDAMTHLKDTNMNEAVVSYAKSGKFLLGICLGMQLLFDKSYEFGEHKGLGLIDGEVVAFDKIKLDNDDHKIPHVGWNKIFTKSNPIFNKVDNPYLYFVHSYHIVTSHKNTIATTKYGYEFVSVVQKENIYGFQPHPEKSHNNGIQILENFTKLN